MAVKSKRQRAWTQAAIDKRRAERELAERLHPYLKLPCFKDPFTDVVVIQGGGRSGQRAELSIAVPSEERIRECCEAILAHRPRPPVHSGYVEAEIFFCSPSPPGKSNSPWTP